MPEQHSSTDPASTPVERAALVRITTFTAKPGRLAELLEAAGENARAARDAAGCHSAEVCTCADEPDTVLVVSRWQSSAAVAAFLEWHEQIAHGSVRPLTIGKPRSTHYRTV